MRRHVTLVLVLVLAFAAWLEAGLVSRPTKTCGTTSYDAEVAAGCTTIKSTEVDADINAIITGGVNNIETANCNAAGLGTACFANGSVTGAKIATGTITSGNILDGTIVDADVSVGAAIKGSKLANAPDGITTTKINDLQVTVGKLQVTASIFTGATTAVATGISISPGTESTIATLPITPRGGVLTIEGQAAFTYNTLGSGSGTIRMRVKQDAVTIHTLEWAVENAGTAATAIPSFSRFDFAPTAGAHTYTVTVELALGSAGTLEFGGANTGRYYATNWA